MLTVCQLFGPPSIVQHDNGREFGNEPVAELANLYPNMQFIKGRPRHSQTQGLVEAANKTVQNKLHAVMQDTGRPDWYNLLRTVQHAMNHQVHAATKKAPYTLVFDRPPRPAMFPGLSLTEQILDEENVHEFIVLQAEDGQEAVGQHLYTCFFVTYCH